MAKSVSKKVSKVAKSRRKIWLMAVDPFAGFDLKPVLKFARQTAERSNAEIHVAYVLAPAGLNWTGEFSGPWFKKYSPVAEQKLDEVLGTEIPRKVLLCKESGQRAAARILLGYATRIKADSILISTHARRGLERMALGSFAETLIMMSKVPVIVTNPNRAVPQSVRRILVPTDLGKGSAKYINAVADYAKQMDAEVVLYYKQPDPLDPIIQQGVYSLGGGWVSLQAFVDDELKRKTKEIEKIENQLRKKNVPVSHVLDSAPGDLIDSIDRAARETNSDMVSVYTQAGAFAASVLGSVARGLVRHSSVPVLVRH